MFPNFTGSCIIRPIKGNSQITFSLFKFPVFYLCLLVPLTCFLPSMNYLTLSRCRGFCIILMILAHCHETSTQALFCFAVLFLDVTAIIWHTLRLHNHILLHLLVYLSIVWFLLLMLHYQQRFSLQFRWWKKCFSWVLTVTFDSRNP